MTTRRDDPERDAWLREALRHAPDADIAAPPSVSDTILRQARAATVPRAAPTVPQRAATSGNTLPGLLASFWTWLARPTVATGFASVMVATVVGMLWWGRPMDEAAMPPPPDAGVVERMAPASSPALSAEASAEVTVATQEAAAPTASPTPAAPAVAAKPVQPAPRAPAVAAAEAPRRAEEQPARPVAAAAKAAAESSRLDAGGSAAQLRNDGPADRPAAQEAVAAATAPPPTRPAAAAPASPPSPQATRQAAPAELADDAAPQAIARAESRARSESESRSKAAPRELAAPLKTEPRTMADSAGAARMAAAPAAPAVAFAAGDVTAPMRELRQSVAAEPERWSWQRGDGVAQPMTPALQAWLAGLGEEGAAAAPRRAEAMTLPLRLLRDGRLHGTLVLGSDNLQLLPAGNARPALQWPLAPGAAAALRDTLDAATR